MADDPKFKVRTEGGRKILTALPRPVVKAAFQPPEPTFTSGSEGADVLVVGAKGLDALESNLLSMGKVAMDAAGYEMAAIMREVTIDSQENYVPVDSGDLHDSADSDEYEPGKGATITKIAAWYANPGEGGGRLIAAPTRASRARLSEIHATGGSIHDPSVYALDQHENMGYKHGLNWSGTGPGQPEYLKRPFEKAIPNMVPRIGDAVKQALGMANLTGIEQSLRDATTYPGYGSK